MSTRTQQRSKKQGRRSDEPKKSDKQPQQLRRLTICEPIILSQEGTLKTSRTNTLNAQPVRFSLPPIYQMQRSLSRHSVTDFNYHNSLSEVTKRIWMRRFSRSISTVSHVDEPQQMKPAIRLENTYQTGPKEKFPAKKVESIVKDVVESYLTDERYEPELCREMSKTMSEVVRNRIKELRILRYKVVAMIHIGSVGSHGFSVASRCLWDHNVDTFSTYKFSNGSLFAVATIFGVYQD